MPAPAVLYKYRSFGDRTVQALCSDQVFFADPSTFNDPLDAAPRVEMDISIEQAKSVLSNLVKERVRGELDAAAKSLRYKGQRTVDHIANRSVREAELALQAIEDHVGDPERGADENASARGLLKAEIERELLKRYGKGILSLASRDDCPLMWSHYGDQHRGVCIGYRSPPQEEARLRQVQYGGSRLVKASDLLALTHGELGVAQKIDDAVLLRKAADWSYEREWRFIHPKGLHDSPLETVEITFGMRCPAEVRYFVLKALEGRAGTIKFYEVFDSPDSFALQRREIDMAADFAEFPRCVADLVADFQEIDDGLPR
jgi:hypothetical protein